MAKGIVTKSIFHWLQLFKVASIMESFQDQWYRKHDGVEPCRNFDIPQEYDVLNRCCRFLFGENGINWVQCPLRSQWYQESCFYSL